MFCEQRQLTFETKPTKMERKKFVLLASAGVIAVAIPTWHYKFRSIEYDKSLAKPQLLLNIWDPEAIIRIGKLYQKQHPDEKSERNLVSLLSDSLSTENGSIELSIARRIKEDFKTASIVTIDGWILSTTEGRQCALYSLTNLK